MITFFFRKRQGHFHSIEELFLAIQKHLKNFEYRNVFMPFHTGFGRFLNLIIAFFNKSKINHITGDVFYLALGLPRKKLILTVHDIGSLLHTTKGLKRSFLRKFWFEIPFARAEHIVVISSFTKDEIMKEFQIEEKKVTIIPDCVSDDFVYSPKEFNNQKPEILAVGTKKNKNLCRLFEAAENLNVKILIIGKLSEQQKYYLDKYQIEYDNFYDLPRQSVVELYRQSDIVYFASLYEGFGMPILEAQAIGRPLITSALRPMKDICGNGAFLVNPYDVGEIRSALERLLEDSALRQTLIKNGLKNVRKYSAQTVAELYEQLYASLLQKNN